MKAIILVLGLSIGIPSPLLAQFPTPATIVVNDHDSGPGSLRDAIAHDRTVVFASNLTVIRLTSGEILVDKPLTILGPGADRLAISGNLSNRVFRVGPNGSAIISRVTIRDGLVRAVGVDSNGNGNMAMGGGIWNEGHLTLSDCKILSNQVAGADSPNRTGGAGEGGGLFHSGTGLSLIRCVVRGNTALGGQGGTDPNGDGSGGTASGGGLALRHPADALAVNLVDSTVDSNLARGGRGGGGIDNFSGGDAGYGGIGGRSQGAGIFVDYSFIATGSAIISNLALGGMGGPGGVAPEGRGGGGGDGAEAVGGGLAASIEISSPGFSLNRSFANCTLSGNQAKGGNGGTPGLGMGDILAGEGDGAEGSGGGLFLLSGTPNAWSLTNCTVAFNRAVSGRGRSAGWGWGGGIVGSCSLQATIIAGNLALTATGQRVLLPNLGTSVTSLGFNLIEDSNGGSVLARQPSDQVGGINGLPEPWNPMLEPLADNGGPTLTHALLPSSPAIDRGGGSLTTDQRGFPRSIDDIHIGNAPGGNGTDIGAYEFGAPTQPVLCLSFGRGNSLILSWPPYFTGFVLQQTMDLTAPGGGWTDLSVVTPPLGTTTEVEVYAGGPFRMFRLRRP